MEYCEKEVWWVDDKGDDQVTECVIYFIWNDLDEVAEVEKVEDEQGRPVWHTDVKVDKYFFQEVANEHCWELIATRNHKEEEDE